MSTLTIDIPNKAETAPDLAPSAPKVPPQRRPPLASGDRLVFSAVLVLPAKAGMILGFRVQGRLVQARFRRWTQGLLVVSGLNLVRQALM